MITPVYYQTLAVKLRENVVTTFDSYLTLGLGSGDKNSFYDISQLEQRFNYHEVDLDGNSDVVFKTIISLDSIIN